MARLQASQLHASLRDPVLGSLGFLNEVMGRYPQAISFAPGAPHPGFLTDVDIRRYTDRFLRHLVDDEGHSPETAHRLLLEYGPSRGIINKIVADALRRDEGIAVSPASIVITVGAQEAMLLVLRALFAGPGDVLAVANPCFVGITGAARLLGIDIVGVDERDDGVDVDALEQACRAARQAGRRIRACYVAPDFSNPGGASMSAHCRARLLEVAEREDLLLLEDNVYGFTALSGRQRPVLKALDTGGRVIHIGTFAKVCFPGARVGYVVADQPVGAPDDAGQWVLARELATLKTMVTVNTSPLSQAVIGGMLLDNDGSLRALSRDKAALYRRNLGCLMDALDRHLGDGRSGPIRYNRPEGGFFVRMHLPVDADTELLEVSASKYGVLWTPMAPFYLDGAGDRQLRLSCSYLDPGQIETGVRRLAAFLKKEISS